MLVVCLINFEVYGPASQVVVDSNNSDLRKIVVIIYYLRGYFIPFQRFLEPLFVEQFLSQFRNCCCFKSKLTESTNIKNNAEFYLQNDPNIVFLSSS
jgi:hypothetical protein